MNSKLHGILYVPSVLLERRIGWWEKLIYFWRMIKKILKIFFKNNFTYVYNISRLYPLQLPILHSHSPVGPFPTISSSGMVDFILELHLKSKGCPSSLSGWSLRL